MKRVFGAEGKAIVLEVPEPKLRQGEVLIQTAFSVVSTGTETTILRNLAALGRLARDEYPGFDEEWPQLRSTSTARSYPLPRPPHPEHPALGYSAAGTVVAVADDVIDLKPGDRVACSGSQSAWHAEQLAVPRNLVVRVPDGVGLDSAAFVTLGAIATEAVRKSDCHFGETLAITGVGLLGLLATQIARSAGYYVFAIDIDDSRLQTARGVGANWSANASREDVEVRVREATAGFGADGVLLTVATESSEPFNQAFDIVRQRGTVVAVGQFGMNIERQRWFHHEANLVVTLAYGPGRYDPTYEEGNVDFPIGLVRWTENRNMAHFLRLLAEGAVDLAPIAPRRFRVEQAPDAYALLMSSERPPTVMFTYGDSA